MTEGWTDHRPDANERADDEQHEQRRADASFHVMTLQPVDGGRESDAEQHAEKCDDEDRMRDPEKAQRDQHREHDADDAQRHAGRRSNLHG
jgi:hypothetical protein